METLETVKAIELTNGKKVYVRSLRFRDFVRFTNLITRLFEDFVKEKEKVELNASAYFEDFIPVMASMTGLKEEEIENLPASDGLKLLRTCIDVILEDQAFLQEIKLLLKAIAEKLSGFTK